MRPNLSQNSRILPIAAFALATVLAACSTSSGGSSGGTRRDPNLITAEELAEYTTLTAADAVRRLRPRWLQARGGGSSGPLLIVDGARVGAAQTELRSLSVSDVQEIRFLNSSDATMRYGTNFPAGAIVVTSRSR